MKITFDKAQKTGQANRMLFGHFLEHFHRQIYGGVYDPTSKFADEDGFRTDVLEALKKIRVPIIRWPGGCYVSDYDWYCGIGKNRIPKYSKAWRVEDSNAFGTDEFIKFCRKLDCEPYICTNAGTGTTEEMSDWVEYCNLEDMGNWAKARIANGYKQPHNVKFWSIGNENWGSHEIGAKDADEWGRLVRESAKNMLRVDPTLELSAAAIGRMDWITNLLKTAGEYLDWVSIHSYWDTVPEGAGYDDIMLYTGEAISSNIDTMRAYLTIFGLEKQIKISYDEWNLRFWHHPNFINTYNRDEYRNEDKAYYEEMVLATRNLNDNNSIYTMADAIFTAAFLNTCLRNCDIVGMACFSPVVNTRGAIFTHKDGIVLRPQYFVFELYVNLLKENVLDIWCENVPVITGEKQGKLITVDTIDVVVTYDKEGYAVAAVNKDAEKTHSIDLLILNDGVQEMRIHTVNGPTQDSYNDIDRTEVGITASEWMPFKGTITLPPHSVNVVELR